MTTNPCNNGAMPWQTYHCIRDPVYPYQPWSTLDGSRQIKYLYMYNVTRRLLYTVNPEYILFTALRESFCVNGGVY